MKILPYIVFVTAFLFFGGIVLFFNFNAPKAKHVVVERIFPFSLIAIFVVQFVGYKDIQSMSGLYPYLASFSKDLVPFLHTTQFTIIVGTLMQWFMMTALLLVMMRPWFHFKTMKWLVKCIATPILVLSAISIVPMLLMMEGYVAPSILYFTLPVEIALALSLCVHYWIKDYKIRISKHSYLEVALYATLLNFATMTSNIPAFFLGIGYVNHNVIDLSIYHRWYIYILLIFIPFALYFGLRKAHKDKIVFTLTFISLGTMLVFLAHYRYDTLFNPDTFISWWNLPWHLCNMAMIIIPLCLIFKLKKLFYFTYFINVFGAVMAMMMPNYSDTLTIWNPEVVNFWINHSIVYMLPILCVALQVFDRPKMKQYFYSSIWFAGYYLIILILNPVFTAFNHPTDYLFINSMFITDKLGSWANNVFKINFIINIKGVALEFHPIYQAVYFVMYLLIGFGVWFIYQLGFDIADRHYALHLKLKGIRIDRLALKSVLNGRSISEPMEGNVGVKLELVNFSKKYGLNKYYAVEDANLEVHGGEVFGFLGPNGAGKSTIIKSIVGIQPITSGDIYVCGYNVKSQPVYAKSQIGFVPDHYALYEKLTGREYLNYIADIYEVSKEDRDYRLLKYIRLFELEDSIDNKIKTYSHGMKQKVTIISALIHNPKVWILDEPLTGLDPTSIFQVKECMKRHAERGNIVFFSSHLIDIVEKLCDRIAIIKHGKIQCIKTVEEIEKSGKTLEQFYLDIIGDNENDPRGKNVTKGRKAKKVKTTKKGE